MSRLLSVLSIWSLFSSFFKSSCYLDTVAGTCGYPGKSHGNEEDKREAKKQQVIDIAMGVA